MLIIGFENTTYRTSEGAGSVELCAVVLNGSIGLGRSVMVTFTTNSGTAMSKRLHCTNALASPCFTALLE